MNKKFVSLGVILLIAGLLVAFSYSSQSGKQAGTLSRQNIIIAPNSLVYSPIVLNKTDVVYVVYTSDNVPINFYLVNSYAFSGIRQNITKGYLPGNFISDYSGRGLYIAIKNSSHGIFPYTSNFSSDGFSAPTYYNGTEILGVGTYYMIYANSGNVPSNITFGYVLPNTAIINETQNFVSSGMGVYGSVSALLFMGGIILIVWGVIAEGKEKDESKYKEEEIQKMYKQIEGRHTSEQDNSGTRIKTRNKKARRKNGRRTSRKDLE